MRALPNCRSVRSPVPLFHAPRSSVLRPVVPVSLQPPTKKIKADKDGACAQLVPYMSCTNAPLVSKLSLRDIRVASLRASNKQHLDHLLKSRIKCEELQRQLATVTQERDSAFAESWGMRRPALPMGMFGTTFSFGSFSSAVPRTELFFGLTQGSSGCIA